MRCVSRRDARAIGHARIVHATSAADDAADADVPSGGEPVVDPDGPAGAD